MVLRMPSVGVAEGEWVLDYAGGPLRTDPDTDPILDEFRDIEVLEARMGISATTPILNDPSNQIYADVQRFFVSITWRSLEPLSQRTYAPIYRNFFAFLSRDRGKDPFHADDEDVGLYQTLRTDFSVNPRGAVSGATWDKDRSALDLFFTWASNPRRGLMRSNPLHDLPRGGRSRATSRRATPEEQRTSGRRFRPTNARAYRGKWISPATYRGWRDVGLVGHQMDPGLVEGKYTVGLPDSDFRGRNVQRNKAWTDLAYLTGLRLGEVSALMTIELPSRFCADASDLTVASAIAKFKRERTIVLPAAAGLGLWTYRRGARADVVGLARRVGRYDGDKWLVVSEVAQRAGGKVAVKWRDSGGWADVRALPFETRKRMLLETSEGPEPLCIWLTEDGMPMSHGAWSHVMRRASLRYIAECERLAVPPMAVSPHCLRFSFALMYLIALHRVIDHTEGFDPREPYEPLRYDRAYRRVQAQLGHSDITTTKEIYLAAFEDMKDADLLRGAAGDIGAIITALAARSARIRSDAQ